ncbi:hypothetical protein ACGFS9_08200 [Streptomyces sp. NPDC048566]|uniref:hypothetical protein n=1 Tax=Streptomyces sp. NPDC048566 TaxID=3365569 RepID=UPI00371ACC44
MELVKTSAGPVAERGAPEGCLVVAIRVPVRIVVFVLVVPLRMVWDGCVAGGRVVRDVLLRPLGRALGWLARALFVLPWVALWRYGLVPAGRVAAWLGRVLIVAPALWLYRAVLTPVGRVLVWCGARVVEASARLAAAVVALLNWLSTRLLVPVGRAVAALARGVAQVSAAVGGAVWAAVAWLVLHLVVGPVRLLYARVLTPVGRAVVLLLTWLGRGLGAVLLGIVAALAWTARLLLVAPALALWQRVLVPAGRLFGVVGREVADALGHAWRVAGHLSLAVGRFLARVLRWTVADPARWAYRTVLTPLGHGVRDLVLVPAAEAVRAAGRATRQALAAAREGARQARADLRRLLLGAPGRTRPSAEELSPTAPRGPSAAGPGTTGRAGPREPMAVGTRTLGSSTTALTKD